RTSRGGSGSTRRPRGRLAPTAGRDRGTRRALVDDGNEAALAARPERVLAGARAGARAEARAALAHEDHPREHVLAGEELDAEHLRVRVTAVPRRAQTFLVCHLVLLLRRECGLERGDRALAVRVRLLVLERGLDVRPAPRRDVLLDLGDRHVLVALRRMRGARGRGRRRFRLRRGRRGLRLRLLLLRGLLRCGLLRTDGLDLDPRQPAAMPVVTAVAGPLLVLPDADLLAQLVADDARGDRGRRREVGVAVAADEQDVRIERLPLVELQAVDEEPLAL